MLPADNLVAIDVSGGTNDGKVDLALRLTDETLSINRVVGNKGGLYSTNAERITAELAHNSLLRLGDQLDLKLQQGQDSDYLHANWMLPLGGDGWHLSVKEEHTNYRIMTHASISGWGKSTTLGLDTGSAKGPSHQGNLHLSAKLNHKLTYT